LSASALPCLPAHEAGPVRLAEDPRRAASRDNTTPLSLIPPLPPNTTATHLSTRRFSYLLTAATRSATVRAEQMCGIPTQERGISVDGISILRAQLEWAHGLLEQAVADLSDEQLHRRGEGWTIRSRATVYA